MLRMATLISCETRVWALLVHVPAEMAAGLTLVLARTSRRGAANTEETRAIRVMMEKRMVVEKWCNGKVCVGCRRKRMNVGLVKRLKRKKSGPVLKKREECDEASLWASDDTVL